MSKGMKIARYAATFAALLFFIAYILKISGVGFFASPGNRLLLPFRVLVTVNMILLYIILRKAKDSADKEPCP